MIKNELQYRVTKSQVDRFEGALRDLRHSPPPRLAKDKKLRGVYEASIRSQLDELRGEMAEYEALASHSRRRLELRSLDDLPKVLVQARIAAGLTQRELAQRLSMKEQQIQRYEATEYASANLSRLKEVAFALGLRVRVEPAKPRSGARHATVSGGRRAGRTLKPAPKRPGTSRWRRAAAGNTAARRPSKGRAHNNPPKEHVALARQPQRRRIRRYPDASRLMA